MPDSFNLTVMPHNYRCGAFNCGVEQIDHALRFELLTAIKEGCSRAYYVETEGVCLGFISLRAESFRLTDSIDREKYGVSALDMSGVLLELVGVDVRAQGQGLGQWLILAALTLTQQTAELIGVRFLVLDSLPERVTFYEKLGFRRTKYQRDTSTVFMVFDLLDTHY